METCQVSNKVYQNNLYALEGIKNPINSYEAPDGYKYN